MSFSSQHAVNEQTYTRDQTRSIFGQVMGLVTLTLGCTALGAYVGRNMTGGTGILFFFFAIACVFGLQFASRAGRDQLSILLLFGLGLFLGLFIAAVIAYYVKSD